MVIERLVHRNGVLTDVEYVGIGPRYDGFTCLQVRRPGARRLSHIEVGRVRSLTVGGRTLTPASSPNLHEGRADELRTFLEPDR